MSDRHVIRVSAESLKTIKQISTEKEIDAGEAADYLVTVARGRLNALRSDNKRRAAGKPAPLRKVTVMTLKPKAEKRAKKEKKS